MNQNVEVWLSKILNENKKRRLEKVKFENGDLSLIFSDEENWSVKTVVKQYSKKKYENKDICIYKFERGNGYKYGIPRTVWQVREVIDLPKIWLIFFERNFS